MRTGKNVWLYGFVQTAVILAISWGTDWCIHGLPPVEKGAELAVAAIFILGLGTLIFGGTAALRRRAADPKECNSENSKRENGNQISI
ncbi:MAG: hypothetical protein K2O63_03945 [Alistipes sp.]|nr:hypothetical protein [Alistipes sp.]